jgi:hypothetical protein
MLRASCRKTSMTAHKGSYNTIRQKTPWYENNGVIKDAIR